MTKIVGDINWQKIVGSSGNDNVLIGIDYEKLNDEVLE